jgi:hypothetical protein
MKFFLAALLSCGIFAFAQDTPPLNFQPLNFQEVFNVVRTNLTDISEEELRRLAAQGLIKELGTKVQLVTNNASAPAPSDEVISRRAIYNDLYGYVQIRSVEDRLPDEFQKWVAQLNTNKIKGIVLDLRYAQGESYNAAAQVADQFAKAGEPLLKIGTNQISASEKTKIDLPVAALANKQTRGAAEALAALVRETGAGLIIGSGTAGEARVFETFTLSTGQQLKIGTVPIEVGTNKLPSKGLIPDLAVIINPSSEKIFYQDPFRSISPSTGQVLASTNEVASAGTNRARRFNEAELVRRHRTGASLDGLDEAGGPLEGPGQPVINDPILARALDFLKGISALQQHR